MSLHGDIRVNATIIGHWSAQRIITGDPNTYRCAVGVEQEGRPPLTREFDLRHRYQDGALSLAHKVLQNALSGHTSRFDPTPDQARAAVSDANAKLVRLQRRIGDARRWAEQHGVDPGLLAILGREHDDTAEQQEPGEAFIQWKGTDACIDWHCCGPEEERYEHHVDGYTFGTLTCPSCGKVWQMSSSIDLAPKGTDPDRSEPRAEQ